MGPALWPRPRRAGGGTPRRVEGGRARASGRACGSTRRRRRARAAPGPGRARRAPSRRAGRAGAARPATRPAAPGARAGGPAPRPGAAPPGPPQRRAPPARPSPARSYTALARYTACPYRFYLQRGLGLPDSRRRPRTWPRRTAAPGSTCCSAARSSTSCSRAWTTARRRRGRTRPPPAATHEVELSAAEVADLLGLVAAFAASALAARLAGAAEVHREHAFAFPLGDPGGPLVNGVVDVLARERTAPRSSSTTSPTGSATRTSRRSSRRPTGPSGASTRWPALRAGAPAVEVVHLFLERAAEPVVARYAAADAPLLEAELRAPRGRAARRRVPGRGVRAPVAVRDVPGPRGPLLVSAGAHRSPRRGGARRR